MSTLEMKRKIGSFGREIEDLKKNQKEIVEPKDTTEREKMLDGMNNRMEMRGERAGEHEDSLS